MNLRFFQSHTRARRSRSQHCHRGQQTLLRHEVTQAWRAAHVVFLFDINMNDCYLYLFM